MEIRSHRFKWFTLFSLLVMLMYALIFNSRNLFETVEDIKRNVFMGKTTISRQQQGGNNSHQLQHLHEFSGSKCSVTISIGMAITSRNIRNTRYGKPISLEDTVEQMEMFKNFLPSFCLTASKCFNYRFDLAYDNNDDHFANQAFRGVFERKFEEVNKRACVARGITIRLASLIRCTHSGRPAWAQNDAMLEAYLDNADFYYRVNDDTEMKTAGWTEVFISRLDRYEPRNVGVVGPHHSGGNINILTYDFVHRTHIDIFGFYYPRVFIDWSADNWITNVYKPNRSEKLRHVDVVHLMSAGTRYVVHAVSEELKNTRRLQDSPMVERYVKYKKYFGSSEWNDSAAVDNKKVIAMSLWGNESKSLWGAIRNAQLAPIIFPGWRLRFYVPSNHINGNYSVDNRFISTLRRHGADVVLVNVTDVHIPPQYYQYLVIDDPIVDYFLIRQCDHRLNERDAAIVSIWMKLNNDRNSTGSVHCIRDHPSHSHTPVTGGMWGGRASIVQKALGCYVSRLLVNSFSLKNRSSSVNYGSTIKTSSIEKGSNSQRLDSKKSRADNRGCTITVLNHSSIDVLRDVLWPRLSSLAYCHDSISCRIWPYSHPFPPTVGRLPHGDYIGRKYDAHQEPIGKESLIKDINLDCSNG